MYCCQVFLVLSLFGVLSVLSGPVLSIIFIFLGKTMFKVNVFYYRYMIDIYIYADVFD